VAAINKTSIQSRGHLFSTNRLVFSISKYFIINDVGHTAEQHSHGRPPGRNYGPVERGVNRQSSAPNGQISAPVGQPSAPHGAVNPRPRKARSTFGPARRGQPWAPQGAVNPRPRTARLTLGLARRGHTSAPQAAEVPHGAVNPRSRAVNP